LQILNDSPAGLASWLTDKFRAWSDCDGDVEKRFSKDELLTGVFIYWATGTIGTSFYPYYDMANAGATRWISESIKKWVGSSNVPVGFALSRPTSRRRLDYCVSDVEMKSTNARTRVDS